MTITDDVLDLTVQASHQPRCPSRYGGLAPAPSTDGTWDPLGPPPLVTSGGHHWDLFIGPHCTGPTSTDIWLPWKHIWLASGQCASYCNVFLLPTAREGNIFRGICQSFCSQGVSGPSPSSGQRIPRKKPPLDRDPRNWHLVAATAAVGMHPTGMHSCYRLQCSCSKVTFLHLSVILFMGGVSGRHSHLGRHPLPPGQTPPSADTPGQTHTPMQTPPGQTPRPPPRRLHVGA